jgi:dihydropteroate synthase
MSKTTYFYPNKTLRLGGNLHDLSTPKLMGILNLTPDSFFDGGKFDSVDAALMQADKMISEGADILDVGGMSTRPGAEVIDVNEELRRVIPVIQAIKSRFATTPLSIDTVHGKVAEEAIHSGVSMINDISAGSFDTSIIEMAAKYQVPYVLMHMQGSPGDMQQSPSYKNVAEEDFEFLLQGCQDLKSKNINQIIIDPGFGFGKSLEHNYELIRNFDLLHQIGFPVMVGISRKSLICKLLKVNPENALNGSSALHTILLLKGANILRVHDVKEALETIKIVSQLQISE